MTKKPKRLNLPEGKLIVYKKARCIKKKDYFSFNNFDKNFEMRFNSRDVLVKLEVPESAHAIRYAGDGYRGVNSDQKCRASKAKVLDITYLNGRPVDLKKNTVYSNHDYEFIYKRDKIVKPKKKFDSRDIVCASGIHFFMTKTRAKKYCL